MLKTMRSASLGEGMGDSEETKFYQDMFDQQLSVQLSSGKGIGLADKLISQLQRGGLAGAVPAAGADKSAEKPAIPSPLPLAHGATLPIALPATMVVAMPAAPGIAAPVPAAGASVPAGAGAEAAAPAAIQSPALASADATAAAIAPRARNPREAFIDSVRPAAERVAQQLGVSTETILAHAALETGWGRHLPSMASNNLFGIKGGGSWQGASVQAATTEVTAGQPQSVQASFRSYPSLSAGLDDYASLVGGSPRFAQALNQGNDVAAYGRGLQHGGYATDPAYVQKLVDTAASVRQLIAAQPLKYTPAPPTTPAGDTG
jgi:flagellar protein FlgJ